VSKRRSVSDKYRMEVTAKEDCPKCFGTGIEMEQRSSSASRKVEITLSVCMCVRVMPRLQADLNTRDDPFEVQP
jgi:hypothetical protein